MKRVRIACSEHLDIKKRINQQNLLVLYRLIASVNAEIKFLRQFGNEWPVHAMIRQFLANRGSGVKSRPNLEDWVPGSSDEGEDDNDDDDEEEEEEVLDLIEQKYPHLVAMYGAQCTKCPSRKPKGTSKAGRSKGPIEQEYSKHACTTKQKHATYDRSQRTSSIPVASTSTSTKEIKNQTKKRAADYKVGAVPLRANKEAIYEDTFTTSDASAIVDLL